MNGNTLTSLVAEAIALPIVAVDVQSSVYRDRLLVSFENGFSASILEEEDNVYYEVAVLDVQGDLRYDTHISDAILRWQPRSEVIRVMKEISELPEEKD